MEQDLSFGRLVRQRRRELDLTQEELARRVGCAAITLRKIEAEDMHPSQQIAERLAMALAIPLDERAEFVRQARAIRSKLPDEAATSAAPDLSEIGGEDLSGRAIRGYALAERVGAGGMGVVYRAVQPIVEREVAVKIILPTYANHPDFIRRFEAEAQLVARLEHPHIVPLYDYWREPGVAYLVMRLLRGGSIQNLLTQGALPVEVVARLLEQICAALYAAHRIGVIHRDLKPGNVLLDEDNNAYLTDFGIAKNFGNPDFENQTQMDVIVGSPHYMSPEQIRSLTVRPQTDMYGLGIMLYEMLTGSLPFTGSTSFDLIQQHIQAPMPPLAARRDGLPGGLDAVISRATAKDPQERYPDVLSLLADFQQNLNHPLSIPASLLSLSDEETDLRETANPFKGLRAFNEADADDFFGREILIQQLLARLGEGGDLNRFLAVVGPSGSGKSSVVKAGLIPAMRRGALPGSENWFVVDMWPGAHPFEELEACLLRVAVNPPASLLSQLKENNRGLLRAVRRILPPDPGVELVLVVDQFEELFTLVADETERALFLDSLATAILEERSRLRLVVTLRADFTDRPLRYVDFGELLNRRFEFVLPLTPDELERTIVGPTHRAGLQIERGLTSAMIREVGDQPGALPLLQYALTELYEQREGRLLTRSAYDKLGGVLGALGRCAEETYARLTVSGQEIARQLYLRLVTLGEGAEDTRRRTSRAEIEALVNGQAAAAVGKVIEAFGKARLLSFDRDPLTRTATIEVAHEALIREWHRLRAWLEESRTDLRLERQLAVAAAEWEQSEQDVSFLLSGARLAQFESWAETTTLALTHAEHTYLKTAIAERNRQLVSEAERQRRELESAQRLAETERQAATRLRARNRVITVISVGSVLLAMLAGALGFRASQNARQAQTNYIHAESQRLAAEAINALNANASAEVVGLLSIRALRLQYSPQGDAALLSAAQLNYPEQLLTLPEPAWPLALSPDGQLLLTVGMDSNLLYMLEAQTGQAIRQTPLPAPILRVAFSPDGRNILTDFEDNTQSLWDAETGSEIHRVQAADRVMTSVFSTDGNTIFVGTVSGHIYTWETATGKLGSDWQLVGRVRALWPEASLAVVDAPGEPPQLWDFQAGRRLHTLEAPADVTDIQFCANGRRVAISYFDGLIRLWDVVSGSLLNTLQGHQGIVRKLACSADGERILTGGDDRTARLWDLNTGSQIQQFRDQAIVSLLALSPDNQRVFTLSDDGRGNTIRVWDVQPAQAWPMLPVHQGIVNGVAFSPDGKWLATSDDNGVRLWDAETGRQVHQMPLEDVINFGLKFSPDNRYLAAGEWHSGVIHLWDVESGQEVRQLTGPGVDGINDLAFSPDGRFLLGGAGIWQSDSQAAVWDVTTGEIILAIPLAEVSGFYGADYSPDGKFLLLAHVDGIARLWDAHTGALVREFGETQEPLFTAKFSPDGKFILTAGVDRVAHIWNVSTGQEVRQFIGHTDLISHAAFSPDGKHIATASYDGTLRVWEVATGLELRRLVGHTAAVENVVFSPTQAVLVSASDDGTARFWDVAYHTTLDYLCSRLLRDLTETERQQYDIADKTATCAFP